MLEVSGLNAAYGRARILFDLALEARTGEVSVLLGRNGAGKSTTLKSIVGLLRPQSGDQCPQTLRRDRVLDGESDQYAAGSRPGFGQGVEPGEPAVFGVGVVHEHQQWGRVLPGRPDHIRLDRPLQLGDRCDSVSQLQVVRREPVHLDETTRPVGCRDQEVVFETGTGPSTR